MRVLETPRMRLRPFTHDDVDDLLGIFQDPEAMRYYPGVKDRDEARAWIQRSLDAYPEGMGLLAAVLSETGAFVGQCGLVYQEVHGRRETEVGYLFLRSIWGRGLATEAARACVAYGFDELARSHIIALIDPANGASRRVAEKVGLSPRESIEKWNKRVCVYALDRPTGPRAVA